MIKDLSIEELMAPICVETPSGLDLRYTTVYEEIMEARRCEDAIAMGDWRHDVKQANWDKVIVLASTALGTKTKDLQIAAWLTEALTVTEGFAGLAWGLELVTGLTERFWDTVYPQVEGGDIEYRATPFEFLAAKVTLRVRSVPLTDPAVTPGYSWLKWRESREVGTEAMLRNCYGEIDEDKKIRREQLLAASAISAEEFDAAVAHSGGSYGMTLREDTARCSVWLQRLEKVMEQKFGGAAPDLAELWSVLQECGTLAETFYGASSSTAGAVAVAGAEGTVAAEDFTAPQGEVAAPPPVPGLPAAAATASGGGVPELSLWSDALAMVEAGRLQEALAMLLYVGNAAESVRDRNRVRLLMGKLCLEAGRADLARPIIEELHGVIQELQLERWESPLWVAEVLVAYYRCLQAGGPRDGDLDLAQALFRRICLLDVTKAMPYRC
ncbi:type VI secretion system protein TssA [Geomonas subterranea]|uniref:type VI secretion system protein TssA n=1 Tax=Geomonas subterranea TaxID=2847989 RepID=UPI001CD456D3|nr:type VI secretion system protein TssA [Geomonas fuzhouensis]